MGLRLRLLCDLVLVRALRRRFGVRFRPPECWHPALSLLLLLLLFLLFLLLFLLFFFLLFLRFRLLGFHLLLRFLLLLRFRFFLSRLLLRLLVFVFSLLLVFLVLLVFLFLLVLLVFFLFFLLFLRLCFVVFQFREESSDDVAKGLSFSRLGFLLRLFLAETMSESGKDVAGLDWAGLGWDRTGLTNLCSVSLGDFFDLSGLGVLRYVGHGLLVEWSCGRGRRVKVRRGESLLAGRVLLGAFNNDGALIQGRGSGHGPGRGVRRQRVMMVMDGGEEWECLDKRFPFSFFVGPSACSRNAQNTRLDQ